MRILSNSDIEYAYAHKNKISAKNVEIHRDSFILEANKILAAFSAGRVDFSGKHLLNRINKRFSLSVLKHQMPCLLKVIEQSDDFRIAIDTCKYVTTIDSTRFNMRLLIEPEMLQDRPFDYVIKTVWKLDGATNTNLGHLQHLLDIAINDAYSHVYPNIYVEKTGDVTFSLVDSSGSSFSAKSISSSDVKLSLESGAAAFFREMTNSIICSNNITTVNSSCRYDSLAEYMKKFSVSTIF